MEETRLEAPGLHAPGSRLTPGYEATLPIHFVPLRLVLKPSGVAVELTRPDMLIGRHSEADVRLPLPDVSRRHCRFTFSDGSWHVRDLKSLNGTYVNDQPIECIPVGQGDTVRIGGFTFEVDLVGTAQTSEILQAAEGVLLSISRALPRPDPEREQRRAS
jgi:pSer/pThr/pTyr-binding forkhead associated (FHA) protein